MKITNMLLLLCQLSIALLAVAYWPVEPLQEPGGSNCSAPPGHPESLTLGGQVYHYAYDAKGRVLSRTGKYTEYRMQYHWGHNAPVTVSEVARDDDGNELGRRVSSFIYDNQHRMIGARNSDGANVRYTVDADARIVGIEDVNSGKRLRIGYDQRCNKPSALSLVGGDRVEIVYSETCEIEKVGENLTPAVAMYIATLFNLLLEASSPASVDLFEQR